jgi:3-hydroxyisobutyrate dehydrogenase
MTLPDRPAIGFIGLGVMGHAMAGHILDAGYRLVVFNRSRGKADDLVERGAEWADTAGLVAAESDVVITMVGYPADVDEVYFGAHGVIAAAKAGAYLVDMTTSSPILARRMAAAASEAGLHALDAPVSGGDVGARNATLTIMVGGEPEDFDAMLPVLKVLGTNVVLQGPAGSGQHTKMANQIAIAGTMIGVVEALAYAQAAALDPETVLASVSVGSAASWTLTNLAPRILAGDFEPGFYVKHFIKDMTIAIDAAHAMGLELPGLELAENLYERVRDLGYADSGAQALWKAYE